GRGRRAPAGVPLAPAAPPSVAPPASATPATGNGGGLSKVAAASAAPPPRAETDVRKTLAVLPFQNLSADAALDALGIALADVLITSLAVLSGLLVRPSAYSLRVTPGQLDPAAVARDLDVAWVLMGTLLRNAERLRVSL